MHHNNSKLFAGAVCRWVNVGKKVKDKKEQFVFITITIKCLHIIKALLCFNIV